MWILCLDYESFHWQACVPHSIPHDIICSNNCIWMAICSTGVNLNFITIIICYMLFILCGKQLNNSLYIKEKRHLLEFIDSKQLVRHVSNYSQNKSLQLKLNMPNDRKRYVKTFKNYSNMRNKDSFGTQYEDYSSENYRLDQKLSKKQEIRHQSSPYFSIHKSNISLMNPSHKTKSVLNMLPNLLSSSTRFHSTTSKPSSSSLSHASTESEPYFDPNQSVYITTIRNSTALIPCKVKDIDFSSTVMSWWKEDLPMPLTVGNEISLPRYEIDRTDPGSWTLLIFHVTEADSGTYICQINLANIKEKFFYLKVIAQKNEPDMTKLNDEYVRDDIAQNTLWRASSNQKSVHLFNNPGQNHFLTCLVQFRHPSTTSSIQWYYNGNRIHPTLENNHLKMKQLSVDIQTKWINQTTQMSKLKIGQLTKNHSGIWTCRKVPGTHLESLEESSLDLQTANFKTDRTDPDDSFNYNTGKSSEIRLLPFGILSYFLYFHIIFLILCYFSV
ncbi:unnamed protein product [Schistosoma turkestanicum]|nr:unnamed protein product [Schistosoma turkestanicum]